MPVSEAAAGYETGPARGDIVVLPFPYSDQLAEKRRPALVISRPELREAYGLVWVMMITSADNRPWPCDLRIEAFKKAGLPVPSVVRTAKIACIEQSRIIRRAGRLPPAIMREVDEALARFALA